MKPFTTTENLTDGSIHLPVQFEGGESIALLQTLMGARVTICWIPSGQDKGQAWTVMLELASGGWLEITSSSTRVHGWDEYGSINIAIVSTADEGSERSSRYVLQDFVISRVNIVQWNGEGVVVDAGIELISAKGACFSAVAVDIPGAIFVTLPSDPEPHAWQFPVIEYTRLAIKSS